MDPELAASLAAINGKIDNLTIQVSGVPLIAASMHEFRQDLRMMRAAINDMARVNITAGEVEALHDELDKIANAQIDIVARLTLLEQGRTP